MAQPARRPLTTGESLMAVARSWRLLSVSLLSFPSGLPLGVVWMAIPAWLAMEGIDIKVVGLITLSQAPWSVKFLWAPLMDRWAPPFLGRKRGWIFLTQASLLALGLALAAASHRPVNVVLVGVLALLTAFTSASQDIAYDAYAVEVLHREEHGLAVGARNAFARGAIFLSGRVSITAAAWMGWPAVHRLMALLYLPAMLVSWRAPEPEQALKPVQSLRDAVWGPFVSFLGQHRALEILAFVILYKLSDNLTQALTGPFLVQMGFNAVDIGVANGTIGLVTFVGGTFLGGLLTDSVGLGRALWICGFLQIFSNLGYAAVAVAGVNRPVMYSAIAFEMGTSGMGTGAFGVLLLRLTEKRFSATQFALLSSLFAIPRVFSGPVAGVMADAMGWRDFYVSTLLAGVPGLVMLWRFVPWHVRDPQFHVAEPRRGRPLGRAALVAWAVVAGLGAGLAGLATMAALAGLKAVRTGGAFDLVHRMAVLVRPASTGDVITAVSLVLTALTVALATAATLAARRGSRPSGMELEAGA
jgi:PAT family beta-lactamase induction signal transducer AmpG